MFICIPDLCIQTPRQNTTTLFDEFQVAELVAEAIDDTRYNTYDALKAGEVNNDIEAEEYFVNNLRERIAHHMELLNTDNVSVNREICTNVPVQPTELYYEICTIITVEPIIPCFDGTF